jgi:3',5'-cyclic-nucleotide phosphodiesterase
MSTPPIVNLTVVSGPDLGKRSSFDQDQVTIGRDIHNDFVLTDGFVSNWHGELLREGDSVVYYDLRSRHGSLVLIDDVSINLHDNNNVRHVRVTDKSEIQVGSTLIRLELGQPQEARKPTQSSTSLHITGDDSERYITAAHRSVEDWTSAFAQRDASLDILLRLAGQLNGLTTLEEILDLIVQTTFEAFSAANFFAISLVNDGEDGEEQDRIETFWTRARPGSKVDNDEDPIISRSILERVVNTRESVLFVRDHMGADITESILEAQITACLCAPLVGQHSLIGVMQVDTRGQGSLFSRQDLDLFSVLASNAAFALERAQLTEDIYRMFEGFVQASVAAIEDRDPSTAGHSQRVADYTLELARQVNLTHNGELAQMEFDQDDLTELRYTALLHDFGKVGVREAVLTKAKRINNTEMAVIVQRFSNFKLLQWRRASEELLNALARDGRAPEDQDMASLRQEHEAFCQEMDEGLRLINRVRGLPRLGDEEVDKIQALGQRRMAMPEGHEVPFLTEHELENLTIRRGNLNEEEWADMRSHVAKSEKYLERIPWSRTLKRVPIFAGAHHEKLDGSGYPRGLDADDIPDQVRLLTIADIFDAITASDRPYRDAGSVPKAVRILEEEAKKGQLDPRFVRVFVDKVVSKME